MRLYYDRFRQQSVPNSSTMTPDYSRELESLQASFRSGRTRDLDWRRTQLRALEKMMVDKEAELISALAADLGKPAQEAWTAEISYVAADAAYCRKRLGKWARKRRVATPLTGWPARSWVQPEPLGTVLIIGAWNYPIQIACWKSAPALACGNSMIFKPSELTPTTAVELAKIYIEAGVPAGVFNVLQGRGGVGRQLVEHSDVDKVSLTGSVPTGRKIMAGAAATLKHLTFELGGKSPLLKFEDADLDQAVSAAMMANFYTQGEICSNGTRVFVEESVLNTFTAKLLNRMKNIKIGDPLCKDTTIGSLISKEHRDKVLGYIAKGTDEGARLVCGGRIPQVLEGSKFANGAFIEPAVFVECKDDMTIAREEIFGPVMCIFSFQDEAEVLMRANSSEFGLASGVFTRDIQRGHRMAANLQAGICWINNYNLTPVEIPFGGMKQSGFGRENSEEAIRFYTQLKTVYVEGGEVESPW